MGDDIQANALRKGTAIVYEDIPYRVLEFEHRTQSRKSGFVQVKLRNLRDGTQRQIKLSSDAHVERAWVEAVEMEFLYADGDACVFMNTQDFEQSSMPAAELDDVLPWLQDGMRVQVELLNGEPIGVQLPKSVEIEVREAEAVVKGQTASKSSKPATLANGVTIQVPQFISTGDRIRVDPEERKYLERAR
jgi:elongation factor P